MKLSNIKAILMATIASSILLMSCENSQTENVSLSVSLSNDTESELYVTTNNVNATAYTDIMYILADTVLAPGASITIAQYNGEITFANKTEHQRKIEKALTRISDGIQSLSLKYIADGTLHSLTAKNDKRFTITDYNLTTSAATLKITRDFMTKKGATSDKGVPTTLKFVWETECTLPFDIIVEYNENTNKGLNKKVEPGETIELATLTYPHYASDQKMSEISKANALKDLISSITTFKTRMIHPDLDEKYNNERNLSDAAELSLVFDPSEYKSKDNTLTRKVYNETLIVEFDFYTGSSNFVKDIESPVWENGTDAEMSINMTLREHLIFTYGMTKFNVKLAPGEKLELNPWITYYDEGAYYVISPYTNSWMAYIDEIQYLSIELGGKKHVLDKTNMWSFLKIDSEYDGTSKYVITDKSFEQ